MSNKERQPRFVCLSLSRLWRAKDRASLYFSIKQATQATLMRPRLLIYAKSIASSLAMDHIHWVGTGDQPQYSIINSTKNIPSIDARQPKRIRWQKCKGGSRPRHKLLGLCKPAPIGDIARGSQSLTSASQYVVSIATAEIRNARKPNSAENSPVNAGNESVVLCTTSIARANE